MTGNQALADRARQLADTSLNGSAGRKAYGCVYVALSTTGTLASARKALGDVYPPAVGRDAMAALDQLTTEAAP